MNNKQSSIDWLVKELNQKIDYIPMSQWDEIREIISEAKAMHKEEMEHFFKMGMSLVEGRLWKPIDKFDEAYNKTFGGDNEME